MQLIIDQSKITREVAQRLISVCPFHALSYDGQTVSVSAACRVCRLCVKNGPPGVVRVEEDSAPSVDKDAWRGLAVFAERRGEGVHPVTLELIGKARELAAVTGHPVYAVVIGRSLDALIDELMHYGVDKVFAYDDPVFENFLISPYAAALTDFIDTVKPSAILVGATNIGRSLAPKVAARVGAGLTADCTVLRMKENTDLVQIRPAFGGNIMAQIVTPNTRPQFCTVRYKIFEAPSRGARRGECVRMRVTDQMRQSRTEILHIERKPTQIDISEAEVIVAAGRGVKSAADMAMAEELAELLHAQLACTRPLIEAGWLDSRRQIGLSGRTVHPKLIITLGVSGSVQFAAGMRNADCIVSINTDPNANIFDIAHIGLVGDLYEIVPRLIAKIKEGAHVS